MKLQEWRLKNSNKNVDVKASVPGDITWDLFEAGLVKDPFFGLNHKELFWVWEEDFEYETTFYFDGALEDEDVLLTFDGIDTFAEIYVNETLVGKTENMFLAYEYEIKDFLKRGENKLLVRMRSTLQKMQKINSNGYFGVFNEKRLFIRKAQCHFGWDWAPDMPGYGIYRDVSLKKVSKSRLKDVHYLSYNDGDVSLFATLNYSSRPHVDNYGNVISNIFVGSENDEIRYTLCENAGEELEQGNCLVYSHKVRGAKNFANFHIKNVKLWWPNGYGEQPLYAYKVELLRDGQVLDEKHGKLAFRSVELLQRPNGKEEMSYKLRVNGVDVFVKGSNWVPVECFTGIAKDEKYKKLIDYAKDAGMNMLRVWGGGVYEKDVFYDYCDETGVMVWQDFMFACADIPEEDEAFVENVKKELEYQIKRLRNHPSLVYWCGGNEKTGSYGLQISHGDYLTDIIIRGYVKNFDETRPFARQSPCSLSDVGNDINSGESHYNSGEACLEEGAENYRKLVARAVVPFSSECALMGPGSIESVKRIFPEDKIWPLDEYWEDRLMDNPYAAVRLPFVQRQKLYAERLYGECIDVEDFIQKAQTCHAEFLRAEMEYARANKGKTWGFLNWMYSDIWPSGTWSIVDYYGEPKPVYYQMKRSFKPFVATFVYSHEQRTELVFINDENTEKKVSFVYGVKNFRGEILKQEKGVCTVDANGIEKTAVDMACETNEYLFVEYEVDGRKERNYYSPNMWRGDSFDNEYDYEIRANGADAEIVIKAKTFVKGVEIRVPNNCNYRYSDNCFDLEAGEEKTVVLYGGATLMKQIKINDFKPNRKNKIHIKENYYEK